MSLLKRVYLFGDQTFDINASLSELLQSHGDPMLTSFLEQSCHALHCQIAELGSHHQAQLPRFSSFTDLNALHRKGNTNPALAQFLTCTCQLGLFIRLHGPQGLDYPSADSSCLVGLCTGTLAAAAVSSARSLSDLLELAVQATIIAFKAGLCTWDISRSIFCDQSNHGRPWAFAVSGLSVEQASQAVKDFSEEESIPKTSSPYISLLSSTTQLTISGPPAALEKLRSWGPFSKCTSLYLPVYAPYHAPHLFTLDDTQRILGDGLPPTLSSRPGRIPVIPNIFKDGVLVDGFEQMIRHAVDEILAKPVQWDTMLDQIACHARHDSKADLEIVPIATTADRCIRPAIERLLFTQSDQGLSTKAFTPFQPELSQTTWTPASEAGIAILAVSGRFPSASGMEELWTLLEKGLDVHSVVPPSRWDAATHFEQAPSRKNTSGTPYGCWLDDAGLWDARFFNVSPREAPQVDPAQRIALLTATEAIERAGIVPDRTPSTRKDRVGVWYGCTSNDWMETNSAQDIDAYFIPGGNRAFIPGRINYHYKFSGPSYTIDTACSSSLAAIHMACNALWRREVDTAIAGGTNVLTNPDMTAGLDRGHFLSRTGNCQTFDENADGYCRGEGVATIILKRLVDAITDRDPVIGVIKGIATNHSAEAASITRPHVGAQRELFENILNSSGIDPNDISYVEMHGTGTQAGDAGETASVIETFASADRRKKRAPHQTLHIGSVKANLGHGEAAAGVTSLAKVLLMLKKSTIPPHCGIKKQLNHNIPDLNPRNTFIAQAPVAWPRPNNGVRRVFLNNFSAAGGNTALALEDGPLETVPTSPDPRKIHLVATSAKTYASLEGNLNSYIHWIDKTSDDDLALPRASYTSTARRSHYPHRVAVSGSSLREIKAQFQQALVRKDGSSRPKRAPELCFAFTGQGSQYQGMGGELFSHFSSFRNDIFRYNRLAETLGFPSFARVFENSEGFDHLSPVVVQLASSCLQMALVRLCALFGIRPKIVVGHSLGEYAALNAAGALSEADTIYLVGKRASLLDVRCKQNTHAMLACRASLAVIRNYLGPEGDSYEISCLNGSEDVVLGGLKSELEIARGKLSQNGIKTTPLEVPYAFHTTQVDPILDEFRRLSNGISFNSLSLPMISPLMCNVIREGQTIGPDYLIDHCRRTVNISEAVRSAKMDGYLDEKTMTIEIGPAPVVTKMLRAEIGADLKTFHCLQKGQNATILLAQLCAHLYNSGAEINWSEYHKDFKSAQKVVDIPTYHWDLKNYWIQYVHDWSLRKGDALPQETALKLESSTVHKVLKEEIRDFGGKLIIESDLNRADMHAVVQGHKVWGVPLCTPSVYADIALTVGRYLHRRYRAQDPRSNVEVGPMNIQSALVANSENMPQMLRAAFEIDWKNNTASCTFSSVDLNGSVIEQHSNCSLHFFDTNTCRQQLESRGASVRSQMEIIQNKVSDRGNTYRFSKSMIYKMITQLADFDPNYRGLIEIDLDNDHLEACGRASFKDVEKGGEFHTNPAYIDALSQLGGFVMNANENVDLEKEVFINHGWDSMQLIDAIDETKTYETHVKMHEIGGNLWKGDVTIFDSEKIVGLFGGVALQGVPKRLMQVIVDSANKRSQRKQSSLPKSAAVSNATATQGADPENFIKQAETPLVARAMQILSEESGVALGELTDSTQLSEVGIDSLLSLVVGSRFRDDLSLDMESATLIDFVTIKDLKDFVRRNVQKAIPVPESLATDISIDLKPALPLQTNALKETGIWSKALRIISEESGISRDDLTDDTAFVDIGIDSLLALVIGSRYRDELDLDLPLDASLFIDNDTIRDLRNCLLRDPDSLSDSYDFSTNSSPQTELSSTDVTCLSSTSAEAHDLEEKQQQQEPDAAFKPGSSDDPLLKPAPEIHPAWSMVLQGTPRKAEKILFLFPDGCGAASSYLSLPRIAPSVAVVGFNSPFMKNPTEMLKYPLPSIVSSYVHGLRRHQPHGPYHLGGWSAGGILAYAIASVLIANGEEVTSLVCIDSPAPTKGLDRLPQRWFDHCNNIGLFGTELARNAQNSGANSGRQSPPAWLIPHFHATIEILHDYVARPLSTDKGGPRLKLIWAGECAIDGIRYPKLPPPTDDDEDTEGMKFLTEKRSDFGPGDWALLFPAQAVGVETIFGEDHFSMMRGAGATQISNIIKKSMGVS